MIWMSKDDYKALKDRAEKSEHEARQYADEADRFARQIITSLGLTDDYPQIFSPWSPYHAQIIRDQGAQRFMRDVAEANHYLSRRAREKAEDARAKETLKRIRKGKES